MRDKKNIVVYYRKKRFDMDPFATLGAKRSVYYDLFELGKNSGHEMYLASDADAYLGNMKFKNAIKYENGRFIKCENEVVADAIYDRSGGLSFPSKEISEKVLNNLEFKKLCADKMLTYDFIGEFMPESFPLSNEDDFKKAISNFKQHELVVLKPVSDFGGKGIVIDFCENIKKATLKSGVAYKLQRFVETAGGIKGIVKGRHDLRIVVIDGKIILAHVRTPQKGSYLANVAQGGSMMEVPLQKIPKSVMRIVATIQARVDELFDKPIYSIDFGVMDGKPYIFELNDQIGFPREDMASAKYFIKALVSSLSLRANR